VIALKASQNVGLKKSKGIGLQYVDICWFCTDDEIIVDMAANISKRTRCYSRKTKSSTQHSNNI
jgi:hypothetical protein